MMSRFLLSVLLVALAGCVSLDKNVDQKPTGGLQPAELGDMSNVTVCGNVWMGCLASPKDIGIVGRRGIGTVIDLRADASDVDIERCCRDEGVDYLRVDLDPSEPSPDIDAALDAIHESDREGRSVLLLCDSGARSAIVFAVHRVLHDAVELEVALEEARRAGMKPDAESVVRREVRRLIGT